MSKTKEMVAEPKTETCNECCSEKREDAYRASQEMTEEQLNSICYKSKLLNKYFDTYAELQQAEKKYHEENDAKLKLVEEKKARAKEVEDAYLEYQKVKEEAFTKIAEAEKKYNELRDKFAEDYNGYHMTYVNNNGKKCVTFSDLLDSFFNW